MRDTLTHLARHGRRTRTSYRITLAGLLALATASTIAFLNDFNRLGIALAGAWAVIAVVFSHLTYRRAHDAERRVFAAVGQRIDDLSQQQTATSYQVRDLAREVSSSESAVIASLGELGSSLASDIQRQLAGGLDQMRETLEELTEARHHSDALTARLESVRAQVTSVRASIESMPADIGEYVVLRERLLRTTDTPPAVGGWALTAPTISVIANRILSAPDDPMVVELGSGASTIWLALALRARGGGHCITVEHSADYAAKVRDELEARGLTRWVTVVEGPLVNVDVDDTRYRWYGLHDRLAGVKIDILIVDGPPRDTGPLARFPAFPLLSENLKDGAWVVLDDIIRTDEQQVLDAWLKLSAPAGQLLEHHSTGKSAVLSFRTGRPASQLDERE